jgi:hypothetical protein
MTVQCLLCMFANVKKNVDRDILLKTLSSKSLQMSKVVSIDRWCFGIGMLGLFLDL